MKNMLKPKNKIATILIATFLMLSMTASMMLIPTAKAQSGSPVVSSYAYIAAFPTPVGVE